jgi:hypothetical protein
MLNDIKILSPIPNTFLLKIQGLLSSTNIQNHLLYYLPKVLVYSNQSWALDRLPIIICIQSKVYSQLFWVEKILHTLSYNFSFSWNVRDTNITVQIDFFLVNKMKSKPNLIVPLLRPLPYWPIRFELKAFFDDVPKDITSDASSFKWIKIFNSLKEIF